MRWLLLLLAGCNAPVDYPSPLLRALGLHQAPRYVARDLMPARGLRLLLAHPRLGQAAIRKPGENFDVGWIGPAPVEATLDGAPLALTPETCDADQICHATAIAPAALGLHELCIVHGALSDCSPSALAVVAEFHQPARVAQISDAHIGDGDSLAEWTHVVDAVNAEAPDVVLYTGDAADLGFIDQLDGFYRELERLQAPALMVTGNHDMDNGGLDHFLLMVGPELDFAAHYGTLQLVGLSSGQDLDDGDHAGTLSESSGPDESQSTWLKDTLDDGDPSLVFFHHPLYNALFATVGPARDQLLDLVTRDNVLAVLTGHIHITQVYDRDGESRGLSTSAQSVVPERWPLHYTCARATINGDGFALHTIGPDHVEYRWVSLGR